MSSFAYPFSGEDILENKKAIRKQLLANGKPKTKKKIAVLGGSTTFDFCKLIDIFLLSNGIEAEFYQSEYNQFWNDAYFPSQELLDFHPDIIYIHTSLKNIEKWLPEILDTDEIANAKKTDIKNYFSGIWEKLKQTHHCPIIQNNVEFPSYRIMGNRDCWDKNGIIRFINDFNLFISDYALNNDSFYVNDLMYISSCYGIDNWADDSVWFLYKYACALDAIPYWSFSVSNIIKSVFGKNKKALSIDLDNTLWGGVVGDDGVQGIEIGHETATAECYFDFQKYLKKLKEIGILLTINSKNDLENAMDGLNHPDGLLKPDDFIVIKANWNNKDRNLAETAQIINIGIDSFAFIDDNPAERALIMESLPDVSVPQLSDPYTYIKQIDRCGYFEVTSFTKDDIGRNEMYKANAERVQLENAFTDYNDYLLNLDMNADILPFREIYVPRITQLTNKSNQFNLTTRRYTEEEIRALLSDKDHICLYGKMWDRFGDNGIVSIVIGAIKNQTELHMDLWLMSCRVLKKNMEYAMLDELVKQAVAKGIDTIVGYYYPTAKNAMVKNLYESFGFQFVNDDNGNTTWKLNTKSYIQKNKVIKVNGGNSHE